MAIGVHVAQLVMRPVTPAGTVLDKTTATLGQMTDASTELRVLADAAIPNSTNYPAPKSYIEAEARDGYVVNHFSQNYIITYKATDVNSA